MLELDGRAVIPAAELLFTAMRSRGAGGQHVNTSATGVQLRYDIARGALPAAWKRRALTSGDGRLTDAGEIVLRADRHRSQVLNRRDALSRLREFLLAYAEAPTPRRRTRLSPAAKRRRLEEKRRRGALKAARRRPED